MSRLFWLQEPQVSNSKRAEGEPLRQLGLVIEHPLPHIMAFCQESEVERRLGEHSLKFAGRHTLKRNELLQVDLEQA